MSEREEEAAAELSPSEKIAGEQPAGNVEPGVENPESEIKGEANPNTE